jgi:hypothetical protein
MIEFHPVTEIFPLIEGEDFAELVKDVAEHGLLQAICLHPDGRIIDGRNRYRACLQAGKEPHFTTWNGEGSLVAFVVSLNLKRRQLTAAQRAAASLASLPMLEAEAKERTRTSGPGMYGGKPPMAKMSQAVGPSREQAAKIFQVAGVYVQQAKTIQRVAPEKIAEIKAGAKTIPGVLRELKAEGRLTTRSTTGDRERKRRVTAAMRDDDALFQFIEKLYEDLLEKRRAHKHERLKRNWNPESVLKKDLLDIIDWMEGALLNKIQTFTERRSFDKGSDRASNDL